MDDGVWKLLAEKMQKEFEDHNQLEQLLWADVRRLSSGLCIPSGYFGPPASTYADGSQQLSWDDLEDLIDGLKLRRNEPQFGSMVLSRKEMTRLEDAIRDAQSAPPAPSAAAQTLFGFPVIVSDAVPEDEVWVNRRPSVEYGLRWPAVRIEIVPKEIAPEDEVWVDSWPLMEFGLRKWPAAMPEIGVDWVDDVIALMDDFEPPNLQPWQLYIILLVVMLVIMFIVGG